MTEIFEKHFGNFGRRILRRELQKQGVSISEYRIEKILRARDLRSKYGRKKGRNIHSCAATADLYIAANLYPTLNETDRKREIWSMDFTEEKIEGQKIFTCGIISVNSKRLVGFTVNCRNNMAAVCFTLKNAIDRFGAPYMILTDRGSPFSGADFHELLKTNHVIHSMSRPYTPIDNRYIETFWKSMKTELGKVSRLTPEQYKMVLEFYEYYYNYERPHSSIGYRAPMDPVLNSVT